VVREGEEDSKKRSWFSRRKKKSSAPAARVSRPPSATSVSFHKKQRSSQSSVADDDLPPREATSSPIPPSTPRPATPLSETMPTGTPPVEHSEDGDLSSSTLPAHAGFNFNAIKEVIGKAETNPIELQLPISNPSLAHPLHQPTQRSESVPLPSPTFPETTPTLRSSLDVRLTEEREEPIAGPSSYSSGSSLSRTRSLNQIHDEDDSSLVSHGTVSSFRSRNESLSGSPPPLSFGGNDGLTWSTSEESTPTFNAFGDYGAAFNRDPLLSKDALSFPNSSVSSFAPTSFSSYGSTARSAFMSPPPDTSLAFGGVDGSITLSPSPLSVERDPWDITARTFGAQGVKKSASTLDLNPWQS